MDSNITHAQVSEIRYRRLFEAARDGILLLDPVTRKIVEANPFMMDLLGYQRSELVGKELWEIGLLGDKKASQIAFQRLQENGFLRYENLPLRSKTGLCRQVEFVSNVYQEERQSIIQCNIRDITERKHTEERLELLDTCIANLNDIVMVTEADPITPPGPRIVFANEAFERVTGYTAAEVIGRNPHFLQGDMTDRLVLNEIHQALEKHRPIRRQIANYRKDGTQYWLDIDIVPIFDAAGKCTHFAAIERDVTEKKKAEEQLVWKTALFEAQVHSSLDGILVVDGEGRKILQNQRMIELWEIPQEFADETEDTRQLQWVIKQNAHPEVFAEKIAYLLSHPDEVSRDEVELTNGKCFDRYSAPVLGKDGTRYGRIWSFRDITERKRTEALITEQAALLDKTQDAIIVRDLNGKVLFWNKGAERMYKWPREEAIGEDVRQLLYTSPERFEEINDSTLKNGEWSGEIKHLTQDKREIIVEGRCTLIRDREGNPKSILAINSEITEKKKLEAQFIRAQRMEGIGTLAAGIAHDLNNILAPILMSIEILKKGSQDRAEHQDPGRD